jgi:hypothetical protein
MTSMIDKSKRIYLIYIAAYAIAAAAPPISQGALVISGAAALLELELELLPVGEAAEAPDDVEVVLPGEELLVCIEDVDSVDPVEVVDAAADGVGRAPAVNVTSCPPRSDPPSVKVVVDAEVVVEEPVTTATTDPEHVPVNELVIVQPMSMVLRAS